METPQAVTTPHSPSDTSESAVSVGEKKTRICLLAFNLCPHFLLREGSVASPYYNRWLFPAAALLVQLGVGQAFGYQVFFRQLAFLCLKEHRDCHDWSEDEVKVIYPCFFVFLGLSAGVFARKFDVVGPRTSCLIGALLWGGGFFVGAAGVIRHKLALIVAGNGVVGGIGLGLAYASPLGDLMRWFPERPGMATGLSLMGIGGGGIIGASIITKFNDMGYPTVKSFFIIGVLDMAAMMIGALLMRVPPETWRPKGWKPSPQDHEVLSSYVNATEALRTFQFWILWVSQSADGA